VTLLSVRNLAVSFPAPGALASRPVDGVNLDLDRGETLALVGASGCGKTLTTLALLRLVAPPGRVMPGSEVRFDDQDVLAMDDRSLRAFRGGKAGMVFQDPGASLNPVLSIGAQLIEAIRAHLPLSRTDARTRAVALLGEVGFPDPSDRLGAFPHQLSGGLRQRVMIAIALAADPALLIADEPTSALDVTVQAQILDLLDALRQRRGLGLLLVTHDLAIAAERATRVAVMHAGRIVESAPTATLFREPASSHTQDLLAAIPAWPGAGVPS
jgi:ABC-type dipeptide/oligopeptide/nickel transport system ATPase component